MNTATTTRALALAVRPWSLSGRAVLKRLDEVVPGSLFLVLVAMAALGAALADQAARQALRLLGDQSFIGPEYIVLGVEEFAPLIVALTLAQRVGAGFAAEVATLKSDDTLDALSLYDADPARSILAPMGAALVLGGVLLGLVGFISWELAGMAALFFRSSINPFTFFHPEAIQFSGVILLLLKCALFGGLVFLCAVSRGLRAGPGAEEVGRASTNAVVAGVITCFTASLVLDVLWHFGRAT